MPGSVIRCASIALRYQFLARRLAVSGQAKPSCILSYGCAIAFCCDAFFLGCNFSSSRIKYELTPDQALAGKRLAALNAQHQSDKYVSGWVVSVDFKGTKVADADMLLISSLSGVTQMDLTGTAVTDSGLLQLGTLRQLEVLQLSNTAISDDGLRTVGEMLNLKQLSLAGCSAITDNGLGRLQKLNALETLNLSGTSVSDAGIKRLSGMQQLHTVDLTKLAKVTDAAVEQLAALPKLKRLIIIGSGITARGVSQLLTLRNDLADNIVHHFNPNDIVKARNPESTTASIDQQQVKAAASTSAESIARTLPLSNARPDEVVDPEFVDGLTKTKRLLESSIQVNDEDVAKTRRQLFLESLQGLSQNFPLVKTVLDDAPAAYNPVELNRHGRGFDAIRFQTPGRGLAWNLDWEFVYPRNAGAISWYIAPVSGTMQGFTNFTRFEDVEIPGLNLAKPNVQILQSLDDGQLKPGAEYLIWFNFAETHASQFHVRLILTER